MSRTVFPMLLFIYATAQVVWARAKPVDIFHGAGKSDILQLRNPKRNDTKVYNALYNTSDLKWVATDYSGNIVIPYIITGSYIKSTTALVSPLALATCSIKAAGFSFHNGVMVITQPAFPSVSVHSSELEGCPRAITPTALLRIRCATNGSREIATIARAMARIASNTCVRFRKRIREIDYIDIVNQRGEGCMITRTVLHELMHAIGLWHEHQRYDRDNYIKVHYENISPEYHAQFTRVEPYKATTYNVPYDYKSIMHYGKDIFALPNKISMETRNPAFQDVIGNQDDASPSDYFKICEIYGCKTCMGITL